MSDGVSPDDAAMVDALDEVWTRLATLGADLTEEEWKRPTDVPGWSVQDNLTHLTDLEAMILGRPAPDHTPPEGLVHVKNDPGVRNERFVDSRRAWSGADALAEFRELTAERIAGLRALDTAGFDADSWTPQGPGTVRTLLPFRIFDSYAHEQDMRRAVGRPGDTDGRAAELTLDTMGTAMPFVVGKKVGAPDGSTVVFSLTDPLARVVAIQVADGRAKPVEPAPDDPAVRLTMSTVTFERLGCGRVDPDAVLDAGEVTVTGDQELGRRIVAEMNYMF
jgi:uncharacterized protein (TIGR03083 family)